MVTLPLCGDSCRDIGAQYNGRHATLCPNNPGWRDMTQRGRMRLVLRLWGDGVLSGAELERLRPVVREN